MQLTYLKYPVTGDTKMSCKIGHLNYQGVCTRFLGLFLNNGLASFQGRSLSILNSTNMRVNPMEVKEAYNLHGW